MAQSYSSVKGWLTCMQCFITFCLRFTGAQELVPHSFEWHIFWFFPPPFFPYSIKLLAVQELVDRDALEKVFYLVYRAAQIYLSTIHISAIGFLICYDSCHIKRYSPPCSKHLQITLCQRNEICFPAGSLLSSYFPLCGTNSTNCQVFIFSL